MQDELAFELELIDIAGRPELEARYRELLPAVEIDGELTFTYFVDPDALRARPTLVGGSSCGGGEPQAES